MRKQDMMKQFSAEVARYIAMGWTISPDNNSNCLISIKLEREGERQTLRIMEKMAFSHDIYIMERINDAGQTLEEESFYYLWAWRRQDEENHKIVEVEEIA